MAAAVVHACSSTNPSGLGRARSGVVEEVSNRGGKGGRAWNSARRVGVRKRSQGPRRERFREPLRPARGHEWVPATHVPD